MTSDSQKLELLHELLQARACSGLSREETVMLDKLLSEFPDQDAEEYEYLTGQIDVALTEQLQDEIPEYLKQSIIEQGEAALSASGQNSAVVRIEEIEKTEAVSTSKGRSSNAFWGLALAASLVLAIIGWLPKEPSIPIAPEPGPTLSQSRDTLINQFADTVKISWAQTDDPLSKTVTGDVVWSNQAQEGYMRFQGLPANDPQKNQYQLWIFDEKREKHPVDGGVFDAVDGELIVPIEEKLRVYSPTLFAVTLEQPGGVVVSDKEHIIAIAKLETG